MTQDEITSVQRAVGRNIFQLLDCNVRIGRGACHCCLHFEAPAPLFLHTPIGMIRLGGVLRHLVAGNKSTSYRPEDCSTRRSHILPAVTFQCGNPSMLLVRVEEFALPGLFPEGTSCVIRVHLIGPQPPFPIRACFGGSVGLATA